MHTNNVDSHLFVIFGGTGDLARRKLLPALYHLLVARRLKQRCFILGVGRSQLEEAAYREMVEVAVEGLDRAPGGEHSWCREFVHYQAISDETPADFAALKDRIEALEDQHKLTGNRVLYLALPPQAVPHTITRLGETGMHKSRGWTRIVIEKPFGHDLDSAIELNTIAHRYFDESQIHRLDHYLGKETVQNILVFRFANPLFESVWNRERIKSVEITVAEQLGLEDRARYYDQVGALRDMVQNHMTQLLTLVAMEVPVAYEAESIRNEKLKVLRSIRKLDLNRVHRGQYGEGNINGSDVPAYRYEKGVSEDTTTETYVDLEIRIDNWRWQGVPFILKTGKRLPERTTQVRVTFREPPISLFQSFDSCRISSNVLLIRLQPEEGFSLSFEVKKPGDPFETESREFSFNYEDAFGNLPEAYETLIHDILKGDHTLFVHADEVEASWRLYMPVLHDPPEIMLYESGSWGPGLMKRKERTEII